MEFLNQPNKNYRKCYSETCETYDWNCSECPESEKPVLQEVRFSALIPISKEDEETLDKLRDMLHPCTPLWDALDALSRKINIARLEGNYEKAERSG